MYQESLGEGGEGAAHARMVGSYFQLRTHIYREGKGGTEALFGRIDSIFDICNIFLAFGGREVAIGRVDCGSYLYIPGNLIKKSKTG